MTNTGEKRSSMSESLIPQRALAVIPARGGSKRIPRKNIKEFCGKPIIAYSIIAAVESGRFDEVMVSTDDEEIARIAVRYGAKVPFMRSADMSTDHVTTAPVLLEVLSEYAKRNRTFNSICCIYPTAPFVTASKLSSAIEQLEELGADCVLPIVKYSYPPQRCLVKRDGRIQMLHPENYAARTQDLEPSYHDCGQFYCLNVSSLLEQQRLFCTNTIGIEIPESETQDIDTMEDWKIAELKFSMFVGG
jgi:pseudaminic acid cytidylyltransferase